MTYQNVTIIGGGVLGAQIALVSALHGKNVTIWGRKKSIVRQGSAASDFIFTNRY
ncbi:3-hydroxyacyl-CoA dehydrogenase NAD-binding domain-containing protein [Fructilactobacillus florum]|uniref:3-hydroxyacyl-CoA dehydrogenase NAD-binding domain-containing protein n=1 Tax=Fructilactobacillus florum TaxID=640331 RepID=UPI000AC301FC